MSADIASRRYRRSLPPPPHPPPPSPRFDCCIMSASPFRPQRLATTTHRCPSLPPSLVHSRQSKNPSQCHRQKPSTLSTIAIEHPTIKHLRPVPTVERRRQRRSHLHNYVSTLPRRRLNVFNRRVIRTQPPASRVGRR